MWLLKMHKRNIKVKAIFLVLDLIAYEILQTHDVSVSVSTIQAKVRV